MVDFVQTMKDWRRMCKAYTTDDDFCCDGCPVVNFHEHGCGAIFEMEDSTNWQRYADTIREWAAEHPVVYPTWGEWFVSRGMLPEKWDNLTSAYMNVGCVPNLIHSPIPADIAEKLGIEPKEG